LKDVDWNGGVRLARKKTGETDLRGKLRYLTDARRGKERGGSTLGGRGADKWKSRPTG